MKTATIKSMILRIIAAVLTVSHCYAMENGGEKTPLDPAEEWKKNADAEAQKFLVMVQPKQRTAEEKERRYQENIEKIKKFSEHAAVFNLQHRTRVLKKCILFKMASLYDHNSMLADVPEDINNYICFLYLKERHLI